MSEAEAQEIAELRARLARLEVLAKESEPKPPAEAQPAAKQEPQAAQPAQVAVDKDGVPLNVPIAVPVTCGVWTWKPAKIPWYRQDPERAIWGRWYRRGPRIGG